MAGTFAQTLRQLFPRATVVSEGGGGDLARLELGAVVDVGFDRAQGAIVVTFARGPVVRFHADPGTWSVVDHHLALGDLSFDDPAAGLRRLAELLGTARDYLDA